MNFYFNYFLLIGREHINCLLSTVHICTYLFPEKVDYFHWRGLLHAKIKSAAKE